MDGDSVLLAELVMLLIFSLPFLCAGGFGLGQYFLAQRGKPAPYILPVIVVTAFSVCFYNFANTYNWETFFWAFPTFWSGSALVGTAVGWLLGRTRRRRKDFIKQAAKEDPWDE